ncbi:hypothetical protein B0I33_10710 [Prauserella shujinwangii]|uniref:DUF6457 domain-containing protein n=1 Tax=Prauserella shujinwangii TaxID=1453103 RepID=A0A2T0LS38_9PSEU|nr:DUF6457 domain-containing protein [Prauserella shujinwangii]PRX46433.1 hypothetical protein B0I33_10710 [Prauserella shujinwangii]
MDDVREWTSALCSDLDLDPGELDPGLVLAMARDVGRVVAKPAAPLTVYLVGMAVARGLPPAEAARRLGELTQRWPRIDWRD